MSSVELKALAPNFTLMNYQGEAVSLADFRDKKNVLLVLNRGFL